jgi:phosphoglycerate dehydrogenase-like enzyme
MTRHVVALDEPMPDEVVRRLSETWRQCSFTRVGPEAGSLGAEAFVHWGSCWEKVVPLVDELAGRLRWVHTWAAGIDEVLRRSPRWLETVTFTNSRGAQAPSVAEYVLARIVHAEWFRVPRTSSCLWSELSSKRLAVLGFGAIGRRVAELVGPLGLSVTGLVRHMPESEALAVERVLPDRWQETLAVSDYLVISVPLTAETKGLVDRSWLGSLPSHGVVINVARGEVVVTDDLEDALRNRRLAAAYLDVTDPEPLPEEHPLRAMLNCFITPHIAGSSAQTQPRILEILDRNLAAFCDGSGYVNVVDPRKDY